MKAIFMWFELMSDLSVNFLKSQLDEVHVKDDFSEVAEEFLNCELDKNVIYLSWSFGEG